MKRVLFISVLYLLGSGVFVSPALAQAKSTPRAAAAVADLKARLMTDERSQKIRELKISAGVYRDALTSDPEQSIHVSTAGADESSCGPSHKPCRTIATALKRAREAQNGSGAETLELVNIEIAAGTYNESVLVTLNWIRFRGAGAASTSIVSPAGGAVRVFSSQPVYFEGLTMKAPNSVALLAADNSYISVNNCEFRDSRDGIRFTNTGGSDISNSVFVNNRNGLVVTNGSTALTSGLTITGISTSVGTGVIVADASAMLLADSSITQTRTGVSNCCSSSVYSFGGLNITNTMFGVEVGASHLELLGSTIGNSTIAGISMDHAASAIVASSSVANNDRGISVAGNSYLTLVDTTVTSNNVGVAFDLFGKGLISFSNVSGNTTNTQTSRGGEFYVEP